MDDQVSQPCRSCQTQHQRLVDMSLPGDKGERICRRRRCPERLVDTDVRCEVDAALNGLLQIHQGCVPPVFIRLEALRCRQRMTFKPLAMVKNPLGLASEDVRVNHWSF